MSAVFSRIQCDEFEVKLVGITPDTSADLEPADSDAIFCLDLNAFGLDGVLRWVNDARRTRPDEPEIVLPTFVVIGTVSRLPFDEAYGVLRTLSAVGTAYYEWPEKCPTFPDAIRAFGAEANQVYRMFIRDEQGFRPAASADMMDDVSSAQEPQEPTEEVDLSVYADPPVRLHDEDFRQLVRRMDSDLSNPED